MRTVTLVAFGGRSTEHDVSVITGVMTLNALRGAGEDAFPVYVDKNGVWQTAPFMNDVAAFSDIQRRKTDQVAFCFGSDKVYVKKGKKLMPIATARAAVSCMHGKNGEDGTFPAIMRECRIPVTSPAMTESAVLMDKWLSKLVFRALDAPVLPFLTFSKEEFFSDIQSAVKKIKDRFGFPVCVKPARLGSSIGISVAEREEEATEGAITAFRYDARILVEPALQNFTEYSLAVYQKGKDLRFGAPNKQVPAHKIYTFDEKYLSDGGYLAGARPAESNRQTVGEKNGERSPNVTAAPSATSFNAAPSSTAASSSTAAAPSALTGDDTPSSLANRMREIAEKVYRGMRLTGVVRMDFLEKEGDLYLNEINAVPGSLSYYFFADTPESAGRFFLELIEEGVAYFREEESQNLNYPSAVLSGLGKGKKGGKRRGI